MSGRPTATSADLRRGVRRCATLVSEGYNNHEIAAMLHISLKYVEQQIGELYQYYHIGGLLSNRAKLALAIADDRQMRAMCGEEWD